MKKKDKLNLKLFFSTVFNFVLISCIQAQFIQKKEISTPELLPINSLNVSLNSEDGFFWFGTEEEGLVRFDGKQSVFYTTSNGLRSNNITALFEDANNHLWVGDIAGGVGKLVDNEIEYPFRDIQLYSSSISGFYQDTNNHIWVSTFGNGVYRISGNEIVNYTAFDGVASDSVYSIYQMDETIWVLTSDGISLYDLENSEFSDYNNIKKQSYFDIIEMYQDEIWLASENGLIIISDTISTINSIQGLTIGSVSRLENREDNGATLVSDTHGLFVYSNGSFITPRLVNLALGFEVDFSFIDNTNRRWLYSEEAGLYLLNNHAVNNYRLNNIGLSNINILLEGNNGEIWVGAREGLAIIEPLNDVGNLSSELILDIPVFDIVKHHGGIYILSDNNQIYRYSEKFGLDLYDSFLDQIPKDYIITDLFFDSRSHLWVGTDKGVGVHNAREMIWYELSDQASGNYVIHMTEDESGIIYVGTSDNIHVFDDNKIITPKILSSSLNDTQIRYILPDRNKLFIGTTKGVYLYDELKQRLTLMNESQGIISQNIQGLTFGVDSSLFVATSAGLHKVDIDDNHGNFNSANAIYLKLNDDYSGAKIHHKAILNSGNSVWVGSDSGVYSYNIEDEPNYLGPEIYFNTINVDYVKSGNQKFDDLLNRYPQSNSISSSLPLSHTENNLTFSFTAIDFTNPDRVEYSHRLLGSTNERWTPFSLESTVSIENLEPGIYTFQVRAKNGRQLLSSRPLEFNFKIDPPFYLSYWFFTLLLISLLGIIYLGERVRLQWLEGNKLRELVEERTLSLKENLKEREILIQEVHHRTKNNLAVISGLLELQKSKIEDENIKHTLIQAQGRVQSIALIHEKLYKNESLSKINFRTYVEDLVDVISNSYNVLGKPIQINLKVDEIDITLDQGIPCGLILNELVSNAIEHAFIGREDGEINILFKQEGKRVRFEVSDNGVGFPVDFELKSSSSLGMTLVHTLTSQINGDLNYQNSDGSKFVIVFKLDNY